MEEPVEETYFNWLYTKVASTETPTPSNNYIRLLRELHSSEFVWVVSGDDNRAEDGKDLRKDFLRQAHIHDPEFEAFECSILEMLVAFSLIAEFDTLASSREWFWVMLDNLGLADLNDASYRRNTNIRPILDRFIWRTYNRLGVGGLFPLKASQNDQRKVEIYYQFCEFLMENNIE